MPDTVLGRTGYLGATNGRAVPLSPRANLTMTTNNWPRRYQILKKWLGVVHARETRGCALSWVVDSESLLFRPFNVTGMLARFGHRPKLSVWPSTWPHKRVARGQHTQRHGGGGGGSGGSGSRPRPNSTAISPTSVCWGLDPSQQRLPPKDDTAVPSIMHLLLGIAPSQWPVAELCQFENLFFEDMWVYDAAILAALLTRLRTIHFPRSLSNLVLSFELGLQGEYHYYAAWILANRHLQQLHHPDSIYCRYEAVSLVDELYAHHQLLYQKLAARGVFAHPPGGGNSENYRPRSGVRPAQLVVELLSWPDDDAELRDSVRHVLPGLLERSHWLNFVGWRDALWPVLGTLCDNGWPGGVCLSNCPWSMAMAYACRPSALGVCTSPCGVDFGAAKAIEERFAGDDVSEKSWCHTPVLRTRLACKGRRSPKRTVAVAPQPPRMIQLGRSMVAARSSEAVPELTDACRVPYAYYAQVFWAPLRVLQLLEQLRRAEPKAPLFVLSDAGLDFSRMAARFGAWFAHAGRSQKHDHTQQAALPSEVMRVHEKSAQGNYGDELRYLYRIGTVMQRCKPCEFVVVLEEDTCVNRAPQQRPAGDVGGVIHGWVDYRYARGFEAFLLDRAVGPPPPYGRVWGCAGGCYYRVAALAQLPEFASGTPSPLWRALLNASRESVRAVDMAAPALVHAMGGRVVPWSETAERFLKYRAGFDAGTGRSVRLAKEVTTAFEHKCWMQMTSTHIQRRRRRGENSTGTAAQAWSLPAELASLAREVPAGELRRLSEDGVWVPPPGESHDSSRRVRCEAGEGAS